MEVISRAVSEMRPDLLVMGTHGRSGLLKALIGSVTEEALRSLNVDILAVPPSNDELSDVRSSTCRGARSFSASSRNSAARTRIIRVTGVVTVTKTTISSSCSTGRVSSAEK